MIREIAWAYAAVIMLCALIFLFRRPASEISYRRAIKILAISGSVILVPVILLVLFFFIGAAGVRGPDAGTLVFAFFGIAIMGRDLFLIWLAGSIITLVAVGYSKTSK